MRALELRRYACLAGALILFATCSEDSSNNGEGAGGRGGSGGATGGRGGGGSGGSSSSTGGSTGGSSSGGEGGSGGSGGGAATDAGPYAALEAGSRVRPSAPLPPRRVGYSVFHSSHVSVWEIHDVAVYNRYRPNFDEIVGMFERRQIGIQQQPGTGPIRVIIENGSCCDGWAGSGDVGYTDGTFMSEAGMRQLRASLSGTNRR